MSYIVVYGGITYDGRAKLELGVSSVNFIASLAKGTFSIGHIMEIGSWAGTGRKRRRHGRILRLTVLLITSISQLAHCSVPS